MRRFVIDTDTASDDAVALLLALRSPEIQVEAVTTVAGNVPLPLATRNALLSIQAAGTYAPPVYEGAARPLLRELFTCEDIHGADGLGDQNLPDPTLRPAGGRAAVALLDVIRRYPGEVEVAAIGPLTNLALAARLEPDTLRLVKRLYLMGTAGFGPGNVTSAAEFNVYVDAEAYDIVLRAGLPVTILGLDVCMGETDLTPADQERLMACGQPAARFAVDAGAALRRRRVAAGRTPALGLPDPVAMAAAIWPELMLETSPCRASVCIQDGDAYGQVLLEQDGPPNVQVCRAFDAKGYKQRLLTGLGASVKAE